MRKKEKTFQQKYNAQYRVQSKKYKTFIKKKRAQEAIAFQRNLSIAVLVIIISGFLFPLFKYIPLWVNGVVTEAVVIDYKGYQDTRSVGKYTEDIYVTVGVAEYKTSQGTYQISKTNFKKNEVIPVIYDEKTPSEAEIYSLWTIIGSCLLSGIITFGMVFLILGIPLILSMT